MGVVSLQPSDAEEKWIQLVSRTSCRRANNWKPAGHGALFQMQV